MNSIHSGFGCPRTCLNSGTLAAVWLGAPPMRCLPLLVCRYVLVCLRAARGPEAGRKAGQGVTAPACARQTRRPGMAGRGRVHLPERARTAGPGAPPGAASARRTQDRAHLVQLGEEGQLQGLLEEAHAGTAAGAAAVTDDPLHRLHMAEAPELEAALDVHQLLARSEERRVGKGWG